MTGTTSNLGYSAQQDYQMIKNSLNKQKLKELINIKSESESCLTLCEAMDCSLSGFSIHGIFQARVPEWIAISFSKRRKVKVKYVMAVVVFMRKIPKKDTILYPRSYN